MHVAVSLGLDGLGVKHSASLAGQLRRLKPQPASHPAMAVVVVVWR
eukprot:COSAG06_NODE_22606_length_718_cov_0.966074_1_plen_45_part_10